ncbi:sortase, partial [Streptomyces umbrinus]
MSRSRILSGVLMGAVVALLLGCSSESVPTGASAKPPRESPAAAPATTAPATPAPATPSSASPAPPTKSDTRTRTARLAIPAIGLKDLRVVPYEGTTDDWPGTRIQNGG